MDMAGRLAVVTGGGSGIGRALVVQLAARGCDVAACDVHAAELDETVALAAVTGPESWVTAHACDVADESQVVRFRDEVLAAHDRDHVNLLFNNAGVSGGSSFVSGDRASWDRTFAICWGGVYNCCRAFVPLLVASDTGYVVNVSSVNGFWAALDPQVPNSAYSTAKFAVKGFSESLITDLRVHAPHVKVAVVMPGHVGTGLVENTMRIVSSDDTESARGAGDTMRANAPLSANDAASAILDAVEHDEWRVLVGDDARAFDEAARSDPSRIYDPDAGLSLRTMWE